MTPAADHDLSLPDRVGGSRRSSGPQDRVSRGVQHPLAVHDLAPLHLADAGKLRLDVRLSLAPAGLGHRLGDSLGRQGAVVQRRGRPSQTPGIGPASPGAPPPDQGARWVADPAAAPGRRARSSTDRPRHPHRQTTRRTLPQAGTPPTREPLRMPSWRRPQSTLRPGRGPGFPRRGEGSDGGVRSPAGRLTGGSIDRLQDVGRRAFWSLRQDLWRGPQAPSTPPGLPRLA